MLAGSMHAYLLFVLAKSVITTVSFVTSFLCHPEITWNSCTVCALCSCCILCKRYPPESEALLNPAISVTLHRLSQNNGQDAVLKAICAGVD